MYKRRKKIIERAFDDVLISICNELLKLNPDVLFLTSKKFVEKPDKTLGEEIKGLSVIISSVPVNELNIPSSLSINNNYITTWCDEEHLIKVIHSKINFYDGEINGKLYKNLYMDLDKQNVMNMLKK